MKFGKVYKAYFLDFSMLKEIEEMKRHAVFNSKLIGKNSKGYVNLYLHRLKKKGIIKRIEKNLYTLYDEPFLIASRIVWPSYISCWTALKFYNLTEQVPRAIFVISPYYKKSITFNNTEIVFIKSQSKNMFGYEKINYRGIEAFIADKEKAMIDSALFRKVSFSELQEIIKENIKQISIRKFINYLKILKNSSLIKRFGFVFDKYGRDYYNELKRYMDKTYILLDYTKGKKGKKNKKWSIIENVK